MKSQTKRQIILFVIGLPGSGKTTFIDAYFKDQPNYTICDDFYKSGANHIIRFENSKYYPLVKNSLLKGKNIVMADIVWCDDKKLKQSVIAIKRLTSQLSLSIKMKFLYFENNPVACQWNVKYRNRTNKVESEIRFINQITGLYTIPYNAISLPVINQKPSTNTSYFYCPK